jgi:hypothetical protein
LILEIAGFRRYQREGLILQVAQTAGFDVALELGAVTETISVAAETPLIEPGNSFLGEVVNSRFLEAMPLFTRDINQLVALTPGVTDNPSFRAPKFSSGNSSQISADGGPYYAGLVPGAGAARPGTAQPIRIHFTRCRLTYQHGR